MLQITGIVVGGNFQSGFAGSPASACLNDRETSSREKEFKLQYNNGTPDPSTSNQEKSNILTYILFGAGGVLGMAGLGIGIAIGFVVLQKSP